MDGVNLTRPIVNILGQLVHQELKMFERTSSGWGRNIISILITHSPKISEK